MDMKGDVYNNWTFFCAQWENYEVATGIDKKNNKIRLPTLLSIMGKECHQLQHHLHMPTEGRDDSKSFGCLAHALCSDQQWNLRKVCDECIYTFDRRFDPKRRTHVYTFFYILN